MWRCYLSRVANTYWIDERIESQRVLPRNTAAVSSMQQISMDMIGTRTEVRRRGGIIPSWVLFGIVLLATSAVCVTVNMRTRAKVKIASEQFASMQNEVETMRRANQVLKSEIDQLQHNPRAIESAARSRLNMVRSNEFVVPVE